MRRECCPLLPLPSKEKFVIASLQFTVTNLEVFLEASLPCPCTGLSGTAGTWYTAYQGSNTAQYAP